MVGQPSGPPAGPDLAAAAAPEVQVRLQYLDDVDPFSCAAFPEPRRPPVQPVPEALPLAAQLPAFHRLLGPPLPLEDCALQVFSSGHYLDLDLSLLEQKEELEGFYEDISRGRRPILLLRTQLSVRVQAIIEKLYSSKGPELRRSLFSLKQLFQEDKDLVPEFVNSGGLTCLVVVGGEADQNYQNYILRALSQVMLFVDGMMGIIHHQETVQWLYTLCGSLYRLVVKMTLKLLLVFVEYAESNAQLLIQAVLAVEEARGGFPWSPLVAILEQRNGADVELQVFAITLINKVLAALPDQDSFYDVTDCLEHQGMEQIIQQHLASKGTDPDLRQQLAIYENTLRFEDGLEDPPLGTRSKERRKAEEGRRGHRRSLGLAVQPQSRDPPVPALDQARGGQEEEEWPTSQSTFSSASSLHLSAPLEGEQLGTLGERSIFKLHDAASAWQEKSPPSGFGDKPILKRFEARFLENLVASQKEKRFAISQGRAEILMEAVPGVDQDTSEWWGKATGSGGGGAVEETPPCPEPLGGGDVPGRWSPSRPSFAPSSASIPGTDQVLPGGGREDLPPSITPSKTPGLETSFGLSGPEVTLLVPDLESRAEASNQRVPREEGGHGLGKGALEDLSDPKARTLRAQFSLDAESNLQTLEKTLLTPFRRGCDLAIGVFSKATPAPMKIRDLDFSDLGEEEDFDTLEEETMEKISTHLAREVVGLVAAPPPPPPLPLPGGPPPLPPPPPSSCPPAPPPHCPPPMPPGEETPSPAQKKKTVKLFWRELKSREASPRGGSHFGPGTLWASLEKVEVDMPKLEHLFESRAKEVPSAKKPGDGRKFLLILDPKRSNAINIGLTALPPVHIIKLAILNFDEFAINKEGIEKLLMMVPTEEEKQKIQEAQLANPNLPLGSAEQFLLALSSVTELTARLQLWAFKLDYEATEQEIAEPLFDLKLGMEQLAKNRTFKSILATLLAMGNFLNGSQSQGFELSYLAKVSEVKDTVHRQTLLHHLCHTVVEKFPDTTDLYSEIAAITRLAKVDFDALAQGLAQLEQRCKASWESLKAIAKHDTKPALKSKLVDFLQATTQKIVLLKVVHRRVMNRFCSFLRYLGYDSHMAREVKVMDFCRTLREFALEYRTCHERVLQQQKKRAACRERHKTRGRMITEMEKFASLPKGGEELAPAVLASSPDRKEDEGGHHKSMTSILISPTEPSGRRSRASRGVTKLSPTSMPPTPSDEASGSSEDASEDIMDRLVKSVTHNTPARPGAGRERKRSRVNRKSLRRTLKNGLSDELMQALGLAQAAGVAV